LSLEEASIVPLKDVVKRVKVGFVGSCNDDYCSPEVGVPMIRTTNLTKEGIKLENLKYINNKFHVSHIKSQLNFGDILIARHGHNGLASLWEYKFDAQCLNVVVVEPNESLADKYYLTYLINSPLIQQQIKSLTGGSVQSVVNTKDIADLLIPVPPLSKQKEIANFISLFNKKIAINKSINKNLLQIGQLIFNEYVLKKYEPENHNNWKVLPFGEISTVQNGFAFKSDDYCEVGCNMIRTKDITSLGFVSNESLINLPQSFYDSEKYDNYKFERLDTITVMVGANIGKMGLITDINIPSLQNQNMWRFRPKSMNISPAFVYYYVKKINKEIINMATGSARLFYRKNLFLDYDCIIPNNNYLNKINIIFNSLFDKISENVAEIEKLQNLRDTLLPKLMSGEIDVSEVNCDLKIIIRKIYIKSSKLFLWRYLSENQNHIKNTKSNETLLKSRTIHKINKFLARFHARYRHHRQ
jgi:type I restriction enzyme S subunit